MRKVVLPPSAYLPDLENHKANIHLVHIINDMQTHWTTWPGFGDFSWTYRHWDNLRFIFLEEVKDGRMSEAWITLIDMTTFRPQYMKWPFVRMLEKKTCRERLETALKEAAFKAWDRDRLEIETKLPDWLKVVRGRSLTFKVEEDAVRAGFHYFLVEKLVELGQTYDGEDRSHEAEVLLLQLWKLADM